MQHLALLLRRDTLHSCGQDSRKQECVLHDIGAIAAEPLKSQHHSVDGRQFGHWTPSFPGIDECRDDSLV